VFAVCDQRGALEAVAGSEPYLGGDLVADEADHAGGSEQPEVGEGARVDEAFDRLAERDEGADEDCEHDHEAGDPFAAQAA
jgi:hypothetical protein